MENKFKKALSAALAAIMFLSVVPAVRTYANTQLPVTSLTVSAANVTTNGYNYTLNVNWDRPNASVNPDNNGNPGYNVGQTGNSLFLGDRATNYGLYYRDATGGGGYPTIAPVNVADPNAADNTIDTKNSYTWDLNINHGSMYVFKVLPSHNHFRTQTINGTPITTLDQNANLDTSAVTQEVVFLTDLQVKAAGKGQSLTVDWSRATFDGAEVFAGYNIYFEAGSDVTVFNNAPVKVLVGDPDLKIAQGTNNYTYTFESSKIVQGQFYSVKVEPLVATTGTAVRELRDKQDPTTAIKVGTRTYPINFSTKEYRDSFAFVQLGLNVEEISQDTIRLYWQLTPMANSRVAKLEIESSSDISFNRPTNEATLLGDYAAKVTELHLAKPSTIMYYRMIVTYEVTYKDDQGVDRTREEVQYSTIAVYDPKYEKYTPTRPNILQVTDSDNPVSMNVTWEAFYRKAFNDAEAEEAVGGFLVDRNIEYDMWITDDISLLDDPKISNMKIFDSLPARSLTLTQFEVYEANVLIKTLNAYNRTVTEYVTNQDGVLVKKALDDNKIYYIKMVARRTDGNHQESEFAYSSHFIPPKGPIDTRPIIISKLPLRVKKDALGVEEITKNSINIQWDINWYEAYDASTGSWFSTVGVDAAGAIVFGKDITADIVQSGRVLNLNDPRYTEGSGGEALIRTDLKAIGADDTATPPLYSYIPLRLMDLTGANYEIHVVDYDYMETQGGYERYLSGIENIDGEWQKITPTGDSKHPEYNVTTVNRETPGALQPNTSYAILVRPYNNQHAFYPNVLVATTLSDRPNVDVKPTVPIIYPVESYSTALKVKFEYKDTLSYELSFSDIITAYSDNGIIIPNDEIMASGMIVTDSSDGKKYMEFTIEMLFPETNYYIWVRSYANNTAGIEYSGWSNPIMMTTKELAPPNPPEGLGLASEAHLEIINKENGTSLLPVDFNYMIIEWLRDIRDTEDFATDVPLSSPNIKGSYMAMFDNLIGNRSYYIRAKTVLTVTKSGDTANGIISYYQYVVQVSLNDDFLDCIEVIVPDLQLSTDTKYTITKESAWTQTVHFYTSPYKGEYDGDKNPDLYPLPAKDYEIIYETYSDTLIYRFRSDQIDENGDRDNNVDQRFISKLIQNRTYNYGVDLSTYNNRDVKNRVLEIPYSIAKAFEERKISLTVKAGDTTYVFAPGFMQTAEVKALSDFGVKGRVKITLNRDPDGAPYVPPASEAFASSKQKLTINAITPTQTVSLGYTATPVKIFQKIANRSIAVTRNVGSYMFTSGEAEWVRLADKYDSETGELSFTTTKVASYTTIAKSVPAQNTVPDDSAQNAMYAINSSLNFRDITTYNPAAAISANAIDKIILAVVKGSKEVYINVPMTEEEKNTLYKAGMLVTGAQSVTREEAISALVKLYEAKTKLQIKDYTPLANSPYSDIGKASPNYQAALLKAADLGFFANRSTADPKGSLTFADAMYIINIIMADAGM